MARTTFRWYAVNDLLVDVALTDLAYDGGWPATRLQRRTAAASALTGRAVPYVHVFVTGTFPGRSKQLPSNP